jgi:Uma2 family endonuclease
MQRSLDRHFQTMGEVLKQLGGISPDRVRLHPSPGKATEQDLIRLNEQKKGLYELVDGVLVEKIMGCPESALALWVGHLVQMFLDINDLGFLLGPDGAMRLMPGLIRVPDISFVRWERAPQRGVIPDEPIADMAPDLAVEVLSKGNRRGEMNRKLREYFLAGVQVVWFVNPVRRTVQVFTAPDESTVLTEDQMLEGGDLLPGLTLSLRQIFKRVSRQAERPTKSKNKQSKGRNKSTNGHNEK